MEMDVGEKEPHRPALGDLERLVKVLTRPVEGTGRGAEEGAGEEAKREILLLASAAEDVQRVVHMLAGGRLSAKDRLEQRGAGKSEMIKPERPIRQTPAFSPSQGLFCALCDRGAGFDC